MTRQEYMDGGKHSDYYAQFVGQATIRSVVGAIGSDIINSKHLNDIPLTHWDRAAALMPMKARFEDFGDHKSLAGLVCVAKEAARQWIANQATKI